MIKSRETYRLWRLSLVTVLACSVFSTKFLDPINWPKQIALMCLVPFLVLEALDLVRYRIREFKLAISILSVTIFMISTSALVNNFDITRTLWGTWGRNNGLISQVSLYLCAFSFFVLAGFSKFKEIFIKSLSLGMLPASVYGLIQFFGLDWITWSSTDQLFSFFGNTNFAASIFAIVAIASLFSLVLDKFRSKLSPIFIFQVAVSTFLSWQTKSIQGVVLIALAFLLFVFAKAITVFKLNRVIALSSLAVVAILSVLGFLGKGPLGSFFFQNTFELRSFYWKIGFLMGKDNPIFGVGIDSYGDYYRQFRSLEVARITTVDLTVNNAHNSLIQIFATTGLFGLVAVLLWLGPALFIALKVITNKSKSNHEIAIPILFLSTFAISMISIDNIAVATLHWAITGIALRSLMPSTEKSDARSRIEARLSDSNWSFFKPLLLPLFVALAFVFSWFASSGDRDLYQTFTTQDASTQTTALENRVSSLKRISDSNFFLQESHYGYLSEGLFKADVWPIAYEVTKVGVEKYPMDFNLLDRASVLAERLGKLDEAESFRRRQLDIDPRHPRVWLYLGKDLMEQGKISQAKDAVGETYKLDPLFDESTKEYRRQLEEAITNKSKN